MTVVALGLDLAKSVFQMHGVDASGRAVLRRRLSRGEPVAFFAESGARLRATLPSCRGKERISGSRDVSPARHGSYFDRADAEGFFAVLFERLARLP